MTSGELINGCWGDGSVKSLDEYSHPVKLKSGMNKSKQVLGSEPNWDEELWEVFWVGQMIER